MLHRAIVWVVTVAVVVTAALAWPRHDAALAEASVTVFSARRPGAPIIVPADAIDAERQAAAMLRETLADASGLPASRFPIVRERRGGARRGIFVGATVRGGSPSGSGSKPPFDTEVSAVVRDGAVFVRSERRESVAHAASWFLEKELEARWFMPGPLGQNVPRRAALRLKAGTATFRPGFISRDLGGIGGAPGREWSARNRLEARFDHSHNLVNIFRPADFARTPEMAPMRGGSRFIPAAGEQNFQPNMLSAAAAQHAAAVANRAFAADPKRLSYSLSTNDGYRYDDSAETLAAVSPARFFRHRPDYSNLVFKFTNDVAEIVAKTNPERYLPAYAYYWCENAPDFPVAKNVVPFLTADRSQWSYPEFAAEDRALIERWCRSGAEIVGVYDYFYGNPFFSPRPTLYAVKASIPFQHRAGVRAFYAETNPNWSLDGPKPWLAAQLLWNPAQNSDALLDTYYREFWGEAAAPMRAFFAVCERVWRQQPGPALWLRFYQDDDQARIYPPAARAELRAQLTRAASAATTDAVRARVDFVATGLGISEAFWAFAAARDRAGMVTPPTAEPAAQLDAWQAYRKTRDTFVQGFARVQLEQPLAMAPQNLEIYLRHQPDSRIARELSRTPSGRALLEGQAEFAKATLGAIPREIGAVVAGGVEALIDPDWRQVRTKPVGSSATLEWTEAGAQWRGSGEPWEGRTVELKEGAGGRRVLRMASCRTEGVGQWVPATPGALYAAQVKVRAKTSPGTATFLIVSFLDDFGRHIGIGRIDRLPPSETLQEGELCVIVRAPPKTQFIGYGVRVLNQINDDFAEFSEASLRRLPAAP